jgi:hypothetical protein
VTKSAFLSIITTAEDVESQYVQLDPSDNLKLTSQRYSAPTAKPAKKGIAYHLHAISMASYAISITQNFAALDPVVLPLFPPSVVAPFRRKQTSLSWYRILWTDFFLGFSLFKTHAYTHDTKDYISKKLF